MRAAHVQAMSLAPVSRLHLAQAVTATDRVLLLGRPRKRDVGRYLRTAPATRPPDEVTMHVRGPRGRGARSLLVVAFALGVVATLATGALIAPHAHADVTSAAARRGR